jgi:polynucleotide 5'-kinase involved in rRNA processing
MREASEKPDTWSDLDEAMTDILASGGVVLVIGGPDTGKTTAIRKLSDRAIETGIAATILHADPGQVEVGLPFCVGISMPTSEDKGHTVTTMAFIGGISPITYMPEHLAAVRRLVDMARDYEILIVDMPGIIHGSSARRLHQMTAELITPRHLIALSHGSELNSILAPMVKRSGLTIHTIMASDQFPVRHPALREQRRAIKLAAYFNDAKPITFSLDAVALSGTWLGGGAPIAPHLLKYLATALVDFTRVYYAEQYGSHLGLMVSKPLPEECTALGIALEQFKATEVTVSRAPLFKDLVVGLESDNGKLLGLGRIISLDFRRRTIGISTPVRSPSAVSSIKLGGVRIGDGGIQLGLVRPGEL